MKLTGRDLGLADNPYMTGDDIDVMGGLERAMPFLFSDHARDFGGITYGDGSKTLGEAFGWLSTLGFASPTSEPPTNMIDAYNEISGRAMGANFGGDQPNWLTPAVNEFETTNDFSVSDSNNQQNSNNT